MNRQERRILEDLLYDYRDAQDQVTRACIHSCYEDTYETHTRRARREEIKRRIVEFVDAITERIAV